MIATSPHPSSTMAPALEWLLQRWQRAAHTTWKILNEHTIISNSKLMCLSIICPIWSVRPDERHSSYTCHTMKFHDAESFLRTWESFTYVRTSQHLM
jgi:hypothetical protein